MTFNVAATGDSATVWCPGCKKHHTLRLYKNSWNGDTENPTLDSMVIVSYTQDSVVHKCQFMILDGMICYHTCTHNLSWRRVCLRGWRRETSNADFAGLGSD